VSAVEELRAAARLMRERAEKATPGPWQWWGDRSAPYDGPEDPPPPDYWRISVGDDLAHVDTEKQADAVYVASMHPAVALAVADWLEAEASLWEEFSAAVSAWQDRPDFEKRTFSTLGQALAVARACLGGER
jgi:hypothetical protein